ncbi:hypothetical protein [Phaeobacter inhibens]|uniref:hypothetical protein n=1 Tax=Phaeobacter inhibens TaxID=221822 RepID=UPI002490AD56|nr:hypothetical protein [Phaeobacter inhibens]
MGSGEYARCCSFRGSLLINVEKCDFLKYWRLELLDAPSRWTTAGLTRGLDPLAMLGPIELLYQKGLLPGFSSVTTRIRYYSFHAWWVTQYADAEGGQSTSREKFQNHTRGVEALFALASLNAEPEETGLAGYFFARDKLAESAGHIDFRHETDRLTPEEQRYLNPLGGAFPGIYAGQMEEIGLLAKARNHDLLLPTTLGRRLAAAFAASIGDIGPAFLSAAQAGSVSLEDLESFALFAPSWIDPESEEADLLRTLLMGYQNKVDADKCRGESLRAILDFANQREEAGDNTVVSAERLRWAWHSQLESSSPDAVKLWAAYQAGDVLRTSFEALLRHATLLLEDHPDGRTLSELVTELSAPLAGETFCQWLSGVDVKYGGMEFGKLQVQALQQEATLDEILAPLARLKRHWMDYMDILADAYPLNEEGQTAYTELSCIEALADDPADLALAYILRERVIQRHLRVAARKFHNQNNYTFLIEAESGYLRARETRSIEASGPRLGTAIQFLHDLHLLKDGQITSIGRAWIRERSNSAGEDE